MCNYFNTLHILTPPSSSPGPCKSTTCADKPGAVCTVNGTKTLCGCPLCDEPVSPICGRVGYYVSVSHTALFVLIVIEGNNNYKYNLHDNRMISALM